MALVREGLVSSDKKTLTPDKKINTSSTLDVQNAAFRDEGWYTCYANNELGNTTVSLLLLVGESNRF